MIRRQGPNGQQSAQRYKRQVHGDGVPRWPNGASVQCDRSRRDSIDPSGLAVKSREFARPWVMALGLFR